MNCFLQLYDDATKRIGRQLREEEVKFLQWMYNRYTEEQQEISLKCSEA